MAGVLLVCALTYAAVGAPAPADTHRSFDVLGYVLVTVGVMPLAWRTRAPLTVAWCTWAAWIAVVGLNYADLFIAVSLFIVFYGLGAYVPQKTAIINATVMGTALTAWTLVGHFTYQSVPVDAVFGTVVMVAVPVTFGVVERRRRLEMSALEVESTRRALAAHDAAADAVRAERARIARELHDVVAHEITVMTLQAEGARLRLSKTEPDVAHMFGAISQSGRRGLTEMQRMIGVLRTSEEDAQHRAGATGPRATSHPLASDADDLAPMPSLASLPALITSVQEAGLPVDLAVVGAADVPVGVELSTYRIVQEALTNALKYAGPGARARVEIQRLPATVEVQVEDDGRGTISEAAQSSGGHGLDGMAERVSLLGGTFSYGPRPGGGFRVRATLPSTHGQGPDRAPRRRTPPPPSSTSGPLQSPSSTSGPILRQNRPRGTSSAQGAGAGAAQGAGTMQPAEGIQP